MKPSQATITFFFSSLITLLISYSYMIYLVFYSNLPEEVAYFKNVESSIKSNLTALIILVATTLIFLIK
jgi:hypothetical protein